MTERQDDETEFEALLEREVKRAMAAGFAEGRKFQQDRIASAFRDLPRLTEWCRKHNHMFIITARGVEITSRCAAEYVRSVPLTGERDPITLSGVGAERAAEILVRRGRAVRHASPNCACGTNAAGEEHVDPICKGDDMPNRR